MSVTIPPTPLGPSVNELIRAAGVVWHHCFVCDRLWPFPTGHSPEREWRCVVCVNVLWADLQRKLAGVEE